MKRREAISRLTLTAGALVVLPAAFVSCEKNDPEPDNNNGTGNNGSGDVTIDLSKAENASLNSVGGFLISGQMIIINTGNNTYVALSKVCTHSGCDVTYNAPSNNLPCPCHGSLFSISGAVLNGPATAPLRTYNVAVNGDILTIT